MTVPAAARPHTQIVRRVARTMTRFRFVVEGYARMRAAASRHPLPPGDFVDLEAAERRDHNFLLERFGTLGPVFKAIAGHRLQVCVLGIPRCREFLRQHNASVTPVTIDLRSLFPGGFLREMHGEAHRTYRGAFVRALHPGVVPVNRPALEAEIVDALERCDDAHRGGPIPAPALVDTLTRLTSGMLVHLFFGPPRGSDAFDALMSAYDRLGPHGLEWWIGPEQRRHYFAIRDLVLRQLSGPAERGSAQDCVLRQLHGQGALDDNSLGHLIYMVEMGRFDVCSFFRWLTRFAATHPDWLARIRDEAPSATRESPGVAEAFVLETLRLEQSERLMRVVDRDLVFEGFLIPRFSAVRLCMWESHKSAEAFPRPFAFDPARFLGGPVSRDRYSPFGMDQHNCPCGNLTVQLAALFLETLALRYTLEAVGDGPAIRGRYHWQPAREFSVVMRKR